VQTCSPFSMEKAVQLSRKVRASLQPTLDMLNKEGISYEVVPTSKHWRIVANVAGTKVTWFFGATASDYRASLNFKSIVRRSIQFHREAAHGKEFA